MIKINIFQRLHSLVSNTRNSGSSSVLIISSGGIGDTILFALVFHRFRELVKNNETLVLIVRSDAAKVGFLFGKNVKIFSVDYDLLIESSSYRKKICDYLFQSHFRLVISTDFLRHPKKDELLVKASQAPQTFAMEPRPWPKYDSLLNKNQTLYNRLFDSGPLHFDKVLRWSNFANWLTEKNLPPPLVKLPDELLPTPAGTKRPTIIFIPFSAVKEKQSPASLYISLAEKIPVYYDIFISCGPGEMSNNPTFEPLLKRINVFLDESSFEKLLPTLINARLVIAADTAGMHLAVAAGAKTLCIASAAYVGEIVPYAPEITPDNISFIYTPMECQGCLGNCIHPAEDGMLPCINRINQAEVINNVEKLLGTNS